MRFWPSRQEKRSVPELSISDPALGAYLGIATPALSGVTVGEYGALSIPAVWRAVSLISQTIAQLPLRTLRDVEGVRTRVGSFLDNPGGDSMTPFQWTETIMAHLLIHGNCFLYHIYNGAGSIAALQPIHPHCVTVVFDHKAPEGKYFRVKLSDGSQRELTTADLTHIPALGTDGLVGLSPISVARNSLGTAIAGDRAAAKMFANGAMISGIVTPKGDDAITEDEAKVVKEGLDRKVTGVDNAGGIAVFNKSLDFKPWTMTAEDAQFIESRQFQIEEIARWFGVPPHALMQTEKQTSWGQGVAEQNRGLSRTVLAPWCSRIEQHLSRLLPAPRFVEFEMAGLERGTPAEEIDLLLKQIAGGLLTVNEARHIRNLPPLPGGDSLTSEPAPAEPAEVSL